MAMPSADVDELARFGYKQELDRSLGLFSSFAAGFSYISIMTGVFELFFFGFFSGGPAWIRMISGCGLGAVRPRERTVAGGPVGLNHGRRRMP
jgi:hypothetical protein